MHLAVRDAMGWLRDLMRAGKPPVRSFDQLARKCLEHNRWPAEFRLHGRSLGALFGKLDREVELEWLSNRPAAQETLAAVLGTTREALQIALRPSSSTPGRYLRLRDLPSGRLIDLMDERLFPGVPDEVLHPAGWEGLWWAAPSGAGRSVARAWLNARGRLPPSRAAVQYVELDSPLQPLPEARRGVCVAAPFLPPDAAGFRVVTSPPLSVLAPELVAWAAERLPQGGRFDADELVSWLAQGPLARGSLESAGAVLGLCGLVDEFGMDEVRRRTPRQLIGWYLRRRAGEALDAEGPATQWLKRSAGDAVISLLRQLLADSEEPWWKPRSASEWSSLLPAELRRDADLDWLKLSLARSNSSIRASDVDRAARELPPGAFRLLRALERMGVLERNQHDELALRPHWLVELALGEALAELSHGAPADWGEALLRPHAAPALARALWVRVQSGDLGLFEDVQELEPDRDPALCAAAEAAFRLGGLALLAGQEIAAETVDSTWRLGRELALFAGAGPPQPRIEHPSMRPDSPTTRIGGALLSLGAYHLASFALFEQLPRPAAPSDPSLAPFGNADARHVFSDVLSTLEALPELELAEAAASLVGRLSPRREGEPLHALEAPAAAVDALVRGKLQFDTWLRACATSFGRRALTGLLRDRAELLRGVWSAWTPAHELGLEPSEALSRALWSRAPHVVLARLAAEAPERIAYDLLSAEQWAALRAQLTTTKAPPTHAELWAKLPEAELAALLAAGGEPRDPACLALLWRRSPELLAQTLALRFAAPAAERRTSARDLLEAAPPELSVTLAQKLAAAELLASLSSERVREVEHWLHQRVGARVAGWRSVYEALAALEQRLSGLRA